MTEEMTRVKLAATQEFRGVDGVEGVGIGGETTLIVYVRDLSVAAGIPATFQNFGVKVLVTEKISASASI